MDYRDLLKKFVAFKSVSTDPAYTGEISKTVEWLKTLFTEKGFAVQIIEGYGNPVMVANYNAGGEKTCLIYGHYDVQPVEMEDGWKTDPFSVVEKNGRWYGRGVADNKGQVLLHIATIFDLIGEKKLKYNIKFLIEGNEETGSADLGRLINDYKDLLKTDVIMLSDGDLSGNKPTIEMGFRGVVNMTLTVKTSEKDLHSGLYGGATPNSALELATLLAKFYTPDHKLSVPGIMDGATFTSDMQEVVKKVVMGEEKFKKLTGSQKMLLAPGMDYYRAVWLSPTVEITGIVAGYVKDGYRNSIPGSALAKINVRTAPGQDPVVVGAAMAEFVKQNLPDYVSFTLTQDQMSCGAVIYDKNEFALECEKLLKSAYGSEVRRVYSGGTLPIVTDFQRVLGAPQLLIPLANEDCGMHSAEENLEIKLAEKGQVFSRSFFGFK